MTISALRTVAISPVAPFTASPGYRWLWVAEPADDLDYYADVTAMLQDVGDSAASATFAISPSGTGELQAVSFSVSGYLAQVWLTGGVPGRFYQSQLSIVTAAGRQFSFLIGLQMDTALAANPLPTPPSLGFGTPISWSAAPSLVGVYNQSVYGGSVYA
jgi:hypothetical protein